MGHLNEFYTVHFTLALANNARGYGTYCELYGERLMKKEKAKGKNKYRNRVKVYLTNNVIPLEHGKIFDS